MEATSLNQYHATLYAAAAHVRKAWGLGDDEKCGRVAIVLGSGLGRFADLLTDVQAISYSDIPQMPQTHVPGHSGKLLRGNLAGAPVLCMAGRTHAYEGFHMYQMTFTVRLLHLLGAQVLMATNAAGGCQDGMENGCMMIIKDHVNLGGVNPLEDTAVDPRLGASNPSTAGIYSPRIMDICREVAGVLEGTDDGAGNSIHIKLHEGNYGWSCGPSFETPAEVLALKKVGADVFGMSTVTETLTAAALGMEVFAMSVVTNLAAGISASPLTHEEVQEEAAKVSKAFCLLFSKIIEELHSDKEVSGFFPSSPASPLDQDYTLPASQCLPLPLGRALFPTETSAVTLEGLIGSGLVGSSTTTVTFAGAETAVNGGVSLRSLFPESVYPAGAATPGFLGASIGTTDEGKLLVVGGTSLGAGETSALIDSLVAASAGSLVSVRVAVAATATASDSIELPTKNFVAVKAERRAALPVIPTVSGLFSNSGEITLAAIAGPTVPTPAETKGLSVLGYSAWTTESIDAALIATTAGLTGCVVAVASGAGNAAAAAGSLSALDGGNMKPFSGAGKTFSTPKGMPSAQTSDQVAASVPHHQAILRLRQPLLSTAQAGSATLSAFLASNSASEIPAVLIAGRFGDSVVERIRDSASGSVVIEGLYAPHTGEVAPHTAYIIGSATERVLVIPGTMSPEDGEGADPATCTMAVRILAGAGVKRLAVIAPGFSPVGGELASPVIAKDHVNLWQRNPLFGPNTPEYGLRFPDMTVVYDPSLLCGLQNLVSGVLAGAVTGVALYTGEAENSSICGSAFSNLGFCDVVVSHGPAEVICGRHSSLQLCSVYLGASSEPQTVVSALADVAKVLNNA